MIHCLVLATSTLLPSHHNSDVAAESLERLTGELLRRLKMITNTLGLWIYLTLISAALASPPVQQRVPPAFMKPTSSAVDYVNP